MKIKRADQILPEVYGTTLSNCTETILKKIDTTVPYHNMTAKFCGHIKIVHFKLNNNHSLTQWTFSILAQLNQICLKFLVFYNKSKMINSRVHHPFLVQIFYRHRASLLSTKLLKAQSIPTQYKSSKDTEHPYLVQIF